MLITASRFLLAVDQTKVLKVGAEILWTYSFGIFVPLYLVSSLL